MLFSTLLIVVIYIPTHVCFIIYLKIIIFSLLYTIILFMYYEKLRTITDVDGIKIYYYYYYY